MLGLDTTDSVCIINLSVGIEPDIGLLAGFIFLGLGCLGEILVFLEEEMFNESFVNVSWCVGRITSVR